MTYTCYPVQSATQFARNLYDYPALYECVPRYCAWKEPHRPVPITLPYVRIQHLDLDTGVRS